MEEENLWKSANYRQGVVNKINETIQQTGENVSKNGYEIENEFFQKSRNQEEYFDFVLRFILDMRMIGTKQENAEDVELSDPER